MADEGWARLGRVVADRRLELGLSVRAAAARAGINRATWGTLEDGDRRLSKHLWTAVEEALFWEPGSIDRIIAGGDPTPRRNPHPETIEPALPPGFDLRAEIDRISRLNIPARTRLELVKQITDLYEQAQAEDRQTPLDPGRTPSAPSGPTA